jgi:hypothetical protein
MSTGKILAPTRIRQTHNGFGFIPHRFLRDGFLSSLSDSEARLYLFYVLAADRHGISYYSDRRISDILGYTASQLEYTKNELIHKDLICYEAPVCQVLELLRRPTVLPGERPSPRSFTGLINRMER